MSEPARRSYGENENLTLSDADLRALGEPRPTAGGRKLRAFCPVHGSDHQQSLEVSLDTGRFTCHACACWGYMDWAREEYRRASGFTERGLASASGERDEASTWGRHSGSRRPPVRYPPAAAPKPPEPVREDLEALMDRFREALPGSLGERYLEHRGVSLEAAREYGAGYAAQGTWPHRGRDWKWGRIMVPHTRPDGVPVSLYGRAVGSGDKVPKNLRHDHLPGSKGYFNACALREGSGPLYVCEGFLDALALIASGCERTVAIFSARDWRWHWLPEDVRQLVLAFDSDSTGDEAREKLAAEARLRGIEVAYLDQDSYGGENDPAAAYAAGKLTVGEWPASASQRLGANAGEPPTIVPEAPAVGIVPSGSVSQEPQETAPAGPEDSAGGEPDPVSAADPEGPNGCAASRVLHSLYAGGVCLDIGASGKLRAGHGGGLTDAQRELLREYEAGLTWLLSAGAMSEAWPSALRCVNDALRRRGCAPDGVETAQVRELLNQARDAYEQDDNGLSRYRLQQAALAAAGR